MGKEPTTRGPEDLKGHRFSAVLAKISVGFFPVFWSLPFSDHRKKSRDQEVISDFSPGIFSVLLFQIISTRSSSLPAWYRARPHGGGRAA